MLFKAHNAIALHCLLLSLTPIHIPLPLLSRPLDISIQTPTWPACTEYSPWLSGPYSSSSPGRRMYVHHTGTVQYRAHVLTKGTFLTSSPPRCRNTRILCPLTLHDPLSPSFITLQAFERHHCLCRDDIHYCALLHSRNDAQGGQLSVQQESSWNHGPHRPRHIFR
jgi:hypothetical protein